MRVIKIVNDDFLGRIDTVRHACRGIVIKEDKILMCYQQKEDQYIIPGGGVEDDESLVDCCKREIIEETGVVCQVNENFVDIDELFATMNHINHYFICNVLEENRQVHLTKTEQNEGLTFVWMSIDDALSIFEGYEQYRSINILRFGLYRREYLAIKTYIEFYNK